MPKTKSVYGEPFLKKTESSSDNAASLCNHTENKRKNFWHKGYATEAARSCADYASHILGIKHIYSIIRDNNLPSQGVAKRIGMTPGDTIVKHYRGIDMPHIVFSMTLGELTNFGGITRSIRCSEANETSRNKQLDEPKVSKVRDRAFLPEPQTL